MRRLLGLWAVVVLFGTPVLAQSPECNDCFLSVYDDLALTRNTGRASAFQVKSVYLGLRLANGIRASQLDFRASYPPGFSVIDVQSLVPGAQYDTAGNVAHVEWPSCVSGQVALFRVKVLTTAVPRNAVLQLHDAKASACSDPSADPWSIPAGCYVLNPDGNAPPCTTPLVAATWAGVKELFRTSISR
jgi:hypothetical protein